MWVDVATAASLLGIAVTNVRKAIKVGRITARQVPNPHGGRPKYEIALESLPQEAQDRYWQQQRLAAEVAAKKRGGRPSKAQKEAQARAEAEAAAEVAATEAYITAPGWQREIVDDRYAVVQDTIDMGRKAIAEYIRANNIQATVGTVYRWRRLFKEQGKAGLLTAYGNRKGESAVPDDVFSKFVAIYNSESQPSSQTAYMAAKGWYDEHYSGDCPSLRAFEYRYKRDIPEVQRYMARFGESAFNRKYGYSITRDLTSLTAGEVAVGDHMQLDVLTKMPDGKIVRPWLTAWCDMKSRRFMGWYLHPEAPNSDHILLSFKNMAERFGLPRYIYIDNGKDYRSKDFAGGRKAIRPEYDLDRIASLVEDTGTQVLFQTKIVSNLTAELGIGVQFAIPYSAQSKVIERHFRNHHDKFERLLDGYTGTNTVKRPEVLKRQLKTDKILPYDELCQLLERFLQVLDRIPFGSKAIMANCSPVEIWNKDNPALRRVSDPRTLALFCMRTSRPVKVGKNGVKDSDLGVIYWDDALVSHKGERVYLRRDLQNYRFAWVYSESDELICRAEQQSLVKPLADDPISKEELAEGMRRKRAEKKAVKALIKAQEDIPNEERIRMLEAGVAAINRERGYEEPEEPARTLVMQQTPLDKRVREQERYLKEATTNSPVLPIIDAPAPKKLLPCTATQRDYQNKN